MREENAKNAVKTVSLELKIPLIVNTIQQKQSVAELIIASALKIIRTERILHRDNVEDLQFIIEDFISSISDSNYYENNYQYFEGDEE